MKVIGIDPGIANCACAVVHRDASRYWLLHTETIRTAACLGTGERYKIIYNRVRMLITQWDVDAIAIESVFFNRNISSHNTTAAVVGILQLAAEQAGISCRLVKPQAVKQAVGCAAGADKKSVKKMVSKLLGEVSTHHSADAAGVAMAGLLEVSRK